MGEKRENLIINHNTKEGDCCPECNTKWDGGDILEDLTRRKDAGEVIFGDKSDAELIEYASSYGWTVEDPQRWSNVIGMELSYDDPEHYDGVSYWACPGCGIAWDRWTGKRTERFIKDIKRRNNHINGDKVGEMKFDGYDLPDEDKKHI